VLAAEPPNLNPAGRNPLTINLNHAVQTVTTNPANRAQVTGVQCYDLLAQKQRTYQAKAVVLSTGTIESAKIALQSSLNDPNGLIGKGITDHMIRYRHFVVPPDHPNASTMDSAKLVLQHSQATVDQHAFDIVLELGAEFNQGRYIARTPGPGREHPQGLHAVRDRLPVLLAAADLARPEGRLLLLALITSIPSTPQARAVWYRSLPRVT
jgi:hypothetical protein